MKPAYVIAVASGFGCAACAATPMPIIDLAGVDQVQMNRDLADCFKTEGLYTPKHCMEGKGYKVLFSQ